MIRIISKKEIYAEARSSLAGVSAVRFYIDGNVTFSKIASDMIDFEKKPFFQIAQGKNNDFYLVPNGIQGFKVSQRKKKYTYVFRSVPLCRYFSNYFKHKIEKKKPLEFEIKPCKEIVNGNKSYKLIFNKK